MYCLHLENIHLRQRGLSKYAFIALKNADISLAQSTIKNSKKAEYSCPILEYIQGNKCGDHKSLIFLSLFSCIGSF